MACSITDLKWAHSMNNTFALLTQLDAYRLAVLPSVVHGPTSLKRLIILEAAGPPCRKTIMGSALGLGLRLWKNPWDGKIACR